MSSLDVLILGAGYVGSRLATHLRSRGLSVATTKRAFSEDDSSILQFSIDNEATWLSLPRSKALVITFPALLPTIDKFYTHWRALNPTSHTIAYGSTSRYLTAEPDERVDENSPLDLSQQRVLGENYLQEHGATVLVLSGIVGPNREPKNWFEKGSVKNGNRTANLVHVNDIVEITEFILTKHAEASAGQAFNISNGQQYLSYTEIARAIGAPVPAELPVRDTTSKRVVVDKIAKLLGDQWKWRSCAVSPL